MHTLLLGPGVRKSSIWRKARRYELYYPAGNGHYDNKDGDAGRISMDDPDREVVATKN